MGARERAAARASVTTGPPASDATGRGRGCGREAARASSARLRSGACASVTTSGRGRVRASLAAARVVTAARAAAVPTPAPQLTDSRLLHPASRLPTPGERPILRPSLRRFSMPRRLSLLTSVITAALLVAAGRTHGETPALIQTATATFSGQQAPVPTPAPGTVGSQVPGAPPPGTPGRPGPARDRRPGENERGTSAIRGQVVAADTGAPLRRAVVRAFSQGGGNGIGQTDAEGRYEIPSSPPAATSSPRNGAAMSTSSSDSARRTSRERPSRSSTARRRTR